MQAEAPKIATEELIRVRYGETDQMGHAYYANYFLWFEQARGAWCRDRGFTYKGLEEQGVMLPVVEAHAGKVRRAFEHPSEVAPNVEALDGGDEGEDIAREVA